VLCPPRRNKRAGTPCSEGLRGIPVSESSSGRGDEQGLRFAQGVQGMLRTKVWKQKTSKQGETRKNGRKNKANALFMGAGLKLPNQPRVGVSGRL